MKRKMITPILPQKILLLENNPALPMRFARPSPRQAAVRSTWNGFANFPTVLRA
jgi:hypothetical protein